ncbi:MAG: LTA synthase family protein, partial [Muribaculaceae bacterium]|nr:LTA synthase family protein [Muribaculaceae bacterium]
RSMPVDSTDCKLLVAPGTKPDVYLIILESFSNHLFESLGGEPIATGLDSIAGSGLLFDNFYASSFRTDRALPAILSGFPGQPTTSVMKDVAKAEALPSIADKLVKAGYSTHYFYGGDTNFTNMKAYLMSAGFDEIISDKDFPIGQRMSKWGVPDAPLFKRVEKSLSNRKNTEPHFTVVQTSSSHEPFDVDRTPRSPDEPAQVTAFAYADSCATAFINVLRDNGQWENSLVVIVPDHYGCYPQNLSSALDRHAVPLIFTGGALKSFGIDHTIGSQTDIAATLLSGLGLQHDDFRFSRNLLDPTQAHYAFFSGRNEYSLVAPGGNITINIDTEKTDQCDGDTLNLAENARAYLQTIYRSLDKL